MSASYETIRRLTLAAMGRGLTVDVDAGTNPPTVTVLAGPDAGLHAFRGSLKIPGQSIFAANVVDARAATRHVVTVPQIALLPDGSCVALPKATVIREVAKKLAADLQDLVDAWRLSDAVRVRVEADIAKLSPEEQAVIHRAIQEAGKP